jgi:hypothetical protein
MLRGMAMIKSGVRDRITVVFPEHASPKQQHELGAFVRYCIQRLERELGVHDSWCVSISPALGGYVSHLAVDSRGEILEEQGHGQDGALSTWDALCRVEERLRERRSSPRAY